MVEVVDRKEFETYRQSVQDNIAALLQRIATLEAIVAPPKLDGLLFSGAKAEPMPAVPPPSPDGLPIGTDVALAWSKPQADSWVRDTVGLELTGRHLVNVEIYKAGGHLIGRAAIEPGRNLARFDLDTRRFPNGKLALRAHAWNASKKEDASGDADAGTIMLNIDNVRTPPPQAPSIRRECAPEIISPLGKRRVLAFEDDFDGVKNVALGGSLYLDLGKWKTALWPDWNARGFEPDIARGFEDAAVFMDPFFCGRGDPDVPRLNPFEFRNDSILRINARKMPEQWWENYWMGPSRHWSSGCIHTDGLFNFQYGYAEVRCKMPRGRGDWVGFRALKNANGGIGCDPNDPQHVEDHPWPPEITCFEFFGHEPRKITMETVLAKEDKLPHTFRAALDRVTFPLSVDLTEDFHTFGFEWDEHDIVVTIDGEPYAHGQTPPSMRSSMYLVLHRSIGGKRYAEETKATSPADVDQDSIEASTFDVDYVRVWR